MKYSRNLPNVWTPSSAHNQCSCKSSNDWMWSSWIRQTFCKCIL